MMRSILASFAFCLIVVLPASGAPVGQVAVLDAGHALNGLERAELAASGTTILREMGSGRYLVRVDRPLQAAAKLSPRFEYDIVTPSEKLHHVGAALLERGGHAPLTIDFYDDVTFDEARAAVIAAGGTLVDPLQSSFGRLRTIEAVLDADAVSVLAEGNLAQLVRDRPRVIQSDNAVAAQVSHVDTARTKYGLAGKGVVVSIYEISPLQTDHPEFGNRASGPTATPEAHATHVAGTIGAAGLQPNAKGMAPEATLIGHVVDLSFLDKKGESFKAERPAADNNSWSFVVGWNYSSSRSLNWEWYGFVDEFGAYTPETAGLDELSRELPTLMIYSAGNDNTDSGPTVAPFAHYHGSKDEVWCSSSDESGTDCPASPCGTRCEKQRHPVDGPWTTMSLLASMKNGVAVGAVNAQGQIASFSSRGPARDGRVKPDVVAKGVSQYSTTRNSGYTTMQGTSMAAPVVAGVSALITEQWRRIFGGGDPRPEYVRGLLIHGTDDLGNAGPDYTFGFGLVNAERSADTLAADAGTQKRIRTGVVSTGDLWSVPIEVRAGEPVRVTLAWSDPANIAYTTPALVNNLNVSLAGPNGRRILPWTLSAANPDAPAVRGINVVDNAERIDWTPDVTGTWRIEVDGAGVSTPFGQSFVLFSSNDMGIARFACEDPFEPNETAETAVGEFPDRQTLRASVCGTTDRDFYRFTVTAPGAVLVDVSSEVAVRVSIRVDGAVVATGDVAAGGSRQISASVSAVPEVVVVGIEPLSSEPGEYLIRTTRPDAPVNRGRGIRR